MSFEYVIQNNKGSFLHNTLMQYPKTNLSYKIKDNYPSLMNGIIELQPFQKLDADYVNKKAKFKLPRFGYPLAFIFKSTITSSYPSNDDIPLLGEEIFEEIHLRQNGNYIFSQPYAYGIVRNRYGIYNRLANMNGNNDFENTFTSTNKKIVYSQFNLPFFEENMETLLDLQYLAEFEIEVLTTNRVNIASITGWDISLFMIYRDFDTSFKNQIRNSIERPINYLSYNTFVETEDIVDTSSCSKILNLNEENIFAIHLFCKNRTLFYRIKDYSLTLDGMLIHDTIPNEVATLNMSSKGYVDLTIDETDNKVYSTRGNEVISIHFSSDYNRSYYSGSINFNTIKSKTLDINFMVSITATLYIVYEYSKIQNLDICIE